jgi:4-hydroxy-tetrahydrodipicolinate synthase
MLFADHPVMVTALLTPFDQHGEVDHHAIAEHVDYLAARKVDGLFACGTTGEGAALTDDEVVRVTTTVASAARGTQVRVIAHIGRVSTRATVRLAQRAIDGGADAVAAVVPYYDPLTADQIAGHYRALIRAIDPVPVYAYNIPQRTGNDLQAENLDELASCGLTGMKDSTHSMTRLLQYVDAARRCAAAGYPIQVLTGADALAAVSIAAGATGSVNALGNARPELFAELKRGFAAGDRAGVNRAGEDIAAFGEQLTAGPFLRSLKQATAAVLATAGVWYPTALRAPAT